LWRSIPINMNAYSQRAYRPTFLERIVWFLTGGVRGNISRAARLEDISYHLQVQAMTLRPRATARAFQAILQRVTSVPSNEWAFLTTGGSERKVLVDNEFLKVVLIRWEPGAESARHYHPIGGGMMMVLEGAVRESRFMNESITVPYEIRVLDRYAMSYIDDQLGPHVVANRQENAAITLHAYLKYRPMVEA
jgi:Cysteine dioxygenase type I